MVSRLLALVLVALALLPAAAGAHATLQSTTPANGTALKAAPKQVLFRFSEPVEGSFGAVRVFDAKGERVDDDKAFHPGGDGKRLGVKLQPGLARGSYTATYRVVSADSHIVSGGAV